MKVGLDVGCCFGLSISAMQLIKFISGWTVANVLILMVSELFFIKLIFNFYININLIIIFLIFSFWIVLLVKTGVQIPKTFFRIFCQNDLAPL